MPSTILENFIRTSQIPNVIGGIAIDRTTGLSIGAFGKAQNEDAPFLKQSSSKACDPQTGSGAVEYHQMTKRTKKVGITGKYGVRYGSSLRRQCKKLEIQQHSRYTCPFCGKKTVQRVATGIWNCKGCNRQLAGGAYAFATPAALTARSTIRRLRDLAEA